MIAFRYNLGFNEQMSKIKYELEDLLGDLFTQNTENDNILLFWTVIVSILNKK